MSATAHESGAPRASARSTMRSEVAVGGLAAILAMVVASAALIASGRYFFNDDFAAQFTPVFREIARLLGEGQFPLVTDRIWNGGALLQEYQYAVFNPVSMGLYVLLARIDDLAIAAAAYSLVHIGILASGAYFVCRQFDCARRHAFLAAVLVPLSDGVFFWDATDWIPGLVSMAWLAWAWGFLALTFKRPAFAPAAAIAVFMTLVSGWPFANLALLISAAVAARVCLASGVRAHFRPVAWVALALLAGGLLAAPALAPLELYAAFVRRPPIAGLWAADPAGLLEIGMPFVQTHWGSFSGDFRPVSQPIVYVAWFAPLALASANWTKLLSRRAVWLILGSAVAFAALAMISHIGLLRWMFRLLPYYQFAILVLAAVALTQADKNAEPWRLDRLALVIAVEIWLAVCQAPSLAPVLIYVGVGYAFGLMAWISVRFKGLRDLRWTAFALASSIGVFWLTVWGATIGGYPQFPQSWKPPTRLAALTGARALGPTRLAIVHGLDQTPDPGTAFWSAFGPENTSLETPGANIIGYSSMASQWMSKLSCDGPFGATCGDLIAKVTAVAPPTGRALVDLASVNEVVIQHKSDAAAFGVAVGPGWRQARGAAGEWRFSRTAPVGLVSWTSPGLAAAVVSRTPTKIAVDVRNDALGPGTIVLARAWYPGWSAKLNGVAVSIKPLAGLLVSVELPPHSHGRLEVAFWPSGLTAGLVLAALGALALGLAAARPRLIESPLEKLEALFASRALGI